MKLFDYIYLHIWKKAVFRIGVVYGEINQVEAVVKALLVVTVFFNWRGYKLSNLQLGLSFIGLFFLWVLGGEILIRLKAPHKTNELNNQINEQFTEILKWVREQKKNE